MVKQRLYMSRTADVFHITYLPLILAHPLKKGRKTEMDRLMLISVSALKLITVSLLGFTHY
uniref:Uncharacterized protein n=1 Tax=Anguilla anguilla TaxID=7936 RepID=A0A0E9SY77_ANGAN